LQILGNQFGYGVYVFQHVVVPKSENAKTLIAQPSIALGIIIRLLSVLSSVDLNHQSHFQTHKIDNIPSQRLLSAKFEPFDLPQA